MPLPTPEAAQTNTDAPGGACRFQAKIDDLRSPLNGALQGKSEVVELVIACILARGHLLLEDLPGLGKTTLAKALAAAVGGKFSRIQCTPDLLPSDITGFNIFNQKSREFEFKAGPVFCHVLLADEINRATPRTQSALFEAMAERQVTIDNVCYPLPSTFFVIATQNPSDSHGAYPLPEAQLDRFTMKLSIGYPDRASEFRMLAERAEERTAESQTPKAVMTPEELAELQHHVAEVQVSEKVRNYLLDLVAETRQRPDSPGVSPRGAIVWQRASQARAHLKSRDFVTPDDVQEVADAVLLVRLPDDRWAMRNGEAFPFSKVAVPI